MANICINRFYCSTDNEANYEKILYGLGDRFDLYDLDGRDNWMRGEFDSKWCYPEEAIAAGSSAGCFCISTSMTTILRMLKLRDATFRGNGSRPCSL